ncbi:MAG: hypothetical protein HQK77_12210 [Desulfobacterales bacterium]|nr:hypothetical protein [Desulfobacterales bacterium]
MKTVISVVLTLAVLIIPCGLFAQQEKMTVTSTETVGTISRISPDTIVVQTETSSSPTSYSYTKSTTYVDDSGAPVSMETVKSGLPVKVYYTREGNRMIAEKVVVRKTTETTTEKPGTVEKETTTEITTKTKTE